MFANILHVQNIEIGYIAIKHAIQTPNNCMCNTSEKHFL